MTQRFAKLEVLQKFVAKFSKPLVLKVCCVIEVSQMRGPRLCSFYTIVVSKLLVCLWIMLMACMRLWSLVHSWHYVLPDVQVVRRVLKNSAIWSQSVVNLFAPLPVQSFLDGIVSSSVWIGALVKRIHELGGSLSMEEFWCNREYALKGVSSSDESCGCHGYHGYDVRLSRIVWVNRVNMSELEPDIRMTFGRKRISKGFLGFWGIYLVETHLIKTHKRRCVHLWYMYLNLEDIMPVFVSWL